MRWKAASLLIGVAVMLTGLVGFIARRAEARDDRRDALILASSLTAARIDASIGRAITTLILAGNTGDGGRLAAALGEPVCVVAGRIVCWGDNPPAIDDSGDRFRDGALDGAFHTAAAGALASGTPSASVAHRPSGPPAHSIVVVADQPARQMLAIITLDGAEVVPLADVSTQGAGAARLSSDLGGGTWWAQVHADDPVGFATGLRWPAAIQIAAGAALAAASLVVIARDQRRLRRRATTDSLTGLPNRNEFERRAARMLTQLGRDGRGACLIVIDIDGFKAINDSGGHAAGDRVLAEAGSRLAAAVRATDLVGRWGGDEFVLLLAGISDPLAIPDRTAGIARCLSELPGEDGNQLTASVGAAVFPMQGRDLATLLDLADRAMYDAKDARARGTGAPRAQGDGAPAVPWRA